MLTCTQVMTVNAENQLQMLAEIMSICVYYLLYQDFKLKQRKQITSS